MPAEALAAVLEVAEAHSLGRTRAAQAPALPQIGEGLIIVKAPANGGNLPALACVALREPIILPQNEHSIQTFRTTIGFNVAIPESADIGTGRFAVLIEPIPDGQLGLALVSGATPCQLNVLDAEHADFADVTEASVAYLTAGASGPARVLWRESGTGLKWAVVLLGAGAGAAVPDDPYLLLPAPADFETETAQTDTWSRDDQPAGKTGVRFQVMQTRMAYNDQGDEKLYGFTRTLTFDADGRLSHVSPETRVEIDAPGPCP